MAIVKNGSKYSILLIEDEDGFRSIIKQVLESEGYSIIEAVDAIGGIDALNREEIDLILTDIVMPNGEGFELLKEVLDSHRDLPIICMTGHSLYLKMFIQLGGTGGLLKPFQHSKLLNIVTEQLKDIAQ